MPEPTSNTTTSYEVVSLEEQGQPILAIISDYNEKGQANLIAEDGQVRAVGKNRLYILGNVQLEFTEIVKYLGELRKATNTLHPDLKELWNKTVNNIKIYSLIELDQLSNQKTEIVNLTALRHKLITDRLYFKRQANDFIPRSPEEIEERHRYQQEEAKLEELTQETFVACKKRLLDPSYELSDSILKRLNSLKALAAGNTQMTPAVRKDSAQMLKRLRSVLGLELSGSPEKQAYSILHKLGIFTAHTNLARLRFKVEWDDKLADTKSNDKIKADYQNFIQASKLEDFTDKFCITIDDQSTMDMDDALSLEQIGSKYILGIHISNVASIVIPNSPLESLASERSTSLYYPDKTWHMLPVEWACNLLSLCENQIRPTLSVVVELNDKFEILNTKLVESKIRVSKKLSYDQVDEILHADQVDNGLGLFDFYQLASALEARRFASGGFKIPKKDAYVKIQPDGQLALEEIDENTPSRMIIGELMILANSIMASFAVQNNFPLLFRSQSISPNSKNLMKQERVGGLADDYAIRANLKPSMVGLKAFPHATLGLKAYAQVTSPIRRYTDLVNQRQIINFLRQQKPFYQNQELKAVLDIQDNITGLAIKAQKEGVRFWTLKYLQQRKKVDPEIYATVLRTDLRSPLVQLDEVYLPALCELKSKKSPGDRVKLLINRLSPTFGEIELSEI